MLENLGRPSDCSRGLSTAVDDMALVKVCFGLVLLVTAEHVFRKAEDAEVLMDFRSGEVKARAEEEYKASMHAKVVMNFMVACLPDRNRRKQLEFMSCNVTSDASDRNLKSIRSDES
jgi:hypothetical protein